MPLFQFADLLSFNKAMSSIGLQHVAEDALGVLNVYAQKLVLIPMTLATGFSMALLPSVTKAYVSEDSEEFNRQLNQAFPNFVVHYDSSGRWHVCAGRSNL